MSKTLSLFAIALSLGAMATPLHAGTPTLEEVNAQAGVRHVEQVSCTNPAWPTQRQVATHAGTSSGEAETLRRYIVESGRALCWQGFTHVRVVYRQCGDVAVTVRVSRAARGI